MRAVTYAYVIGFVWGVLSAVFIRFIKDIMGTNAVEVVLLTTGFGGFGLIWLFAAARFAPKRYKSGP